MELKLIGYLEKQYRETNLQSTVDIVEYLGFQS